MQLFCYPKCSTCKKAVKWLEANDLTFEYIDITLTPPSSAVIKEQFIKNDYPIKRFFNTSGIQYRELGIKDQLPNLSENEIFELLASNGKLIKRPFLITDKGLFLGFKEDVWKTMI